MVTLLAVRINVIVMITLDGDCGTVWLVLMMNSNSSDCQLVIGRKEMVLTANTEGCGGDRGSGGGGGLGCVCLINKTKKFISSLEFISLSLLLIFIHPILPAFHVMSDST